MEKLSFIFLHGFLGLPRDWDSVIQILQKELPNYDYLALDYFNYPPLSVKNDFQKWSENFVSYIEEKHAGRSIVLVGYSLGGRLAMNVLKRHSNKILYAYFISANPGFLLTEDFERNKRYEEDMKWSQKFIVDDWNSLIQEWNQQPVFDGSKGEPQRESSDYRRDLLSKALVNWSVSKQEDLRQVLIDNQKKIFWIVGDLDKKYVTLTKRIFRICPDMNYNISPSSSHRVLFDNPIEISRIIIRTMRKVAGPQSTGVSV